MSRSDPPPPNQAHKLTFPSFIISRRQKRGWLHSLVGQHHRSLLYRMAQHESFLLIALRRTPVPDCNTNPGGRLRMQELTGCALFRMSKDLKRDTRVQRIFSPPGNLLIPRAIFQKSPGIPYCKGQPVLQIEVHAG